MRHAFLAAAFAVFVSFFSSSAFSQIGSMKDGMGNFGVDAAQSAVQDEGQGKDGAGWGGMPSDDANSGDGKMPPSDGSAAGQDDGGASKSGLGLKKGLGRKGGLGAQMKTPPQEASGDEGKMDGLETGSSQQGPNDPGEKKECPDGMTLNEDGKCVPKKGRKGLRAAPQPVSAPPVTEAAPEPSSAPVPRTGSGPTDCPPGFIYSAEHGGCGPAPGFCPDGYYATARNGHPICMNGSNMTTCPRGYHRSGDGCRPGAAPEPTPEPTPEPAPASDPAPMAPRTGSGPTDCPPGFIYSAEHGGCGPSPGFCPDGYYATARNGHPICMNGSNMTTCPRGYHRSGDSCRPGAAPEPASEPAPEPAPAPASDPAPMAPRTGSGPTDCPPGFIYSAEHGGCGPSPGFCPDGYYATARNGHPICMNGSNMTTCPRGYHRSGDSCRPD